MVLITDSHVGPLYLSRIYEDLLGIAARVDHQTVPAGETSKSIAQAEKCWQQLLTQSASRDTVIVAVGGGVVGDLAGFIAATFARGITFVQIPTSLLAQVDSSVGGKVGINLPSAKNMVGAFLQPATVLIDPEVLNTLDQRNYFAGMAEVIKYGLIMDPELFVRLEQAAEPLLQRNSDVLTQVIANCCQCKADVVAEDEQEVSGRRAILNYGHTYGHAIEAVFGYGSFLHGEAIAIGMTCAARLAKMLGLVDDDFIGRQTQLFHRFHLPTDCPAERHDELISAMMRDKKVAAGQLNLILPTRIGHVESIPAPDEQLIRASLLNPDT